MADIFSPEKRSEVILKIGGKNTKPEIAVRSMLHRHGYRFTVNGSKNRKLPGRPDIVLPKHNVLIFVHGCFWHGHEGCRDFRIPKSRTEFWTKKIHGKITRDRRIFATLHTAGWKILTIWACEMKTIPAKADLYSRLPALIELEPIAYAFREKESTPMVAEDDVKYDVG